MLLILFSDAAQSYFCNRTQHALLLNLEIYKKILLDHFLGIFFWAPIAVDHYHFGSGCKTDLRYGCVQDVLTISAGI